MNSIVNLIITAIFILGSGYTAKKFLCDTKKAAIERIDKGLSKLEPFAQKLTDEKLPF
jgi:prefoldin subunit 5